MVPMDQKDEVKSKVDIVEVISSYLPLKKSGRNFSGLCPFHTEKTPSFMVSAERQVFKCFGCGESGDVFTFLEKMEGWEFREALEDLAKRVGVRLTTFAPSAQSKEKDKILAVNSLTAKFYSHILNKHPLGEKAREYLVGRGVKEETWREYDLGYAPSGWQNAFDFLVKRGFSGADVAASGLVIARRSRGAQDDGSFYDRFRNRLVFPLKDAKGTILGFSARIIDEAQNNEPKYVNSPETLVFNKGSLLFGLDVAKSTIRSKNEALLVEGEFDVISSHQAGIENVVASKGTALTEKQVVLVSRICENVALCFDRDLAGDAAARRGIELLDMAGVIVKIVRLGQFKDPDEFVKSNPEGFKKAINSAENIYDFYIESALSRFDGATAEGKKKIGGEVLPMFSKISDDMVRAHYIEKLSRVLDLDISLVAQAVEKRMPDQYVAADKLVPGREPVFGKSGLTLEKYFLALLVYGDNLKQDDLALLAADDFTDGSAKDFFSWLHDIISASKKGSGKSSSQKVSNRQKSLKNLLSKLPGDLDGFVDDLFLVSISPALADRELWMSELKKVADRIKHISLKKKLGELSRDIKLAESHADNKKAAILSRKFDELSKTLKGGLVNG
ncbi:MAG: primase protein [Candidatus Curtissbacteria bacterium GW2011_GWA1_40_16]|uniref:DNA primase n=1 Tax=Candidatus Curtissbacteria bacterium GW2011_GWA1_40_16 TaxID=1618405 RepID=A0A0G0RD33_9BACT|nr:MAG: primase protein [Candidatus Curtissbacteria bacterium GW2011_GWA1_40_16]